MKKYSKLWKFLYNKYANSCFSIETNAPNFDKLKNKYDHINLAELRKMLDDYGFDKKKFLTKDELQTLVKLVNFKIMKKFEPR
jgi:N-acetyl-anhydromuramyl-L-alanine amidase AmpD